MPYPRDHHRPPALSRRALLGTGGVLGLAAMLAACGAGSPTPTPVPAAIPPPTPLPPQVGPPPATIAPATAARAASANVAATVTRTASVAASGASTPGGNATAVAPTARATSAIGGVTPVVASSPVAPAGDTGLYVADFSRWPREIKGPLFSYPAQTSYDPAEDEYRIGLLDTAVYNYFTLLPDGRRFGDFRLEVALRCLAGGDQAGYGVVVGVQPPVPGTASYEYHSCLLRASGLYSVVAVPTSGIGSALALNTPSPAIAPLPVWNRLIVEVRGGQLAMQVNDTLLGNWPITIPGPGTIGLYSGNSARSSQQIATQAGFKNLRIIPL